MDNLSGALAGNKVVAVGPGVGDGAGQEAAVLGDDNTVSAGGAYSKSEFQSFAEI